MNYDLCKKLKEAGFPQKFKPPFNFYFPNKEENKDRNKIQLHCSGQSIDGGCYGLGVDDEGKIETWYLEEKYDGKPVKILIKEPTLSELIEACGDRFWRLIKTETKKEWWIVECKNCAYLIAVGGKTPQEAVANLWLELNKKNKTQKR